ncbi:MAG: hypothetical protein H6642_14075 [Caldilineaceae bacterium]|nr:hypothetical protein [Caldilineaceae bacterium]
MSFFSIARFWGLVAALALLSACARSGPAAPVTSTPAVVAVPTFTSTPPGAADAPQATVAPSATSAESALALLPTATLTATATLSPTAQPAEPSGPELTVTGELVNVRSGPDVAYSLAGTTNAGAIYTPTGRNEAGDWWQICCFADEPGWIFGGLVEVTNGDAVAVASDIPPLPTSAPAVAADPTAEPAADTGSEQPVAEEPAAPADDPYSSTAGVFDPAAQYHIVGYRVIGYGENNGGIFNNGGQHMIFINVIDSAGNGIDGAVVKNAINDNINLVTGSKGPGRAEFEMFWDPYKLYVASDPSGPVTSQTTNQMNTAHPHIPDIVGRLGPPEEEYAICPTLDDRCDPPFFHAHWSYEVTFQKVN